MLAQGTLNRSQGVDPRGLVFAVVDVETTGFRPERGDRICEIAVVRMRGDGQVLDEYATLVDPQMPIRNAEDSHGITNTLLRDTQAPGFHQVVGDVLAYLGGAVVVAHKLEFDGSFLSAEFGRFGIQTGWLPGLCTLVLSRVQLDRFSYKQVNIHGLLTGEWRRLEHNALEDARSTARMLATFINAAPQPLFWMGPQPTALPPLQRTGIIAPRAEGLRKGSEGWIANLAARLPCMGTPPHPRQPGLADYTAMLHQTLGAGRIVGESANELAVRAARAGLTQATIQYVHERFVAGIREKAEADGVVTPAERKELQRAAQELNISHVVSDLEQPAAGTATSGGGALKGWRVLPVGDDPEVEQAMEFAEGHGATRAVKLTKTVRLVIAPESSADPQVEKARTGGIMVLAPQQAMDVLNGEISAAQGGLFESGEDAAPATLASPPPAASPPQHPQRPEWHQFWRPRELSPAEYHAQFIAPFAR